MDNFDLKKYVAEGRLFEEENTYKSIEDFLIYNLDVYLEGDMEAEAADEFTLYKEDYTDEDYMDASDIEYFAKTAEKLKSGDITFSSEDYLYDGVASLKGGDIEVKFKDRSVAEDKLSENENIETNPSSPKSQFVSLISKVKELREEMIGIDYSNETESYELIEDYVDNILESDFTNLIDNLNLLIDDLEDFE